MDDEANEEQQQVSVFSFKKNSDDKEDKYLRMAQKGCQHLKSVKHPYVLGYLENIDMDDSFLIITEHALPIQSWLKLTKSDSIDLEITWGLKCILEALHFLHSKCYLTHCNISTYTCFCTINGDWKLGQFDLACNLSTESNIFEEFLSCQNHDYKAPESLDGSWREVYSAVQLEKPSGKKCGWPIDVFAMGKFMHAIYTIQNALSIPKCLESPLKRMLSPDYRRRPSCLSLLNAPCFHAEELQLMSTICELQLKPALECIDIFTSLKDKVNLISKAVCTFKIIPCIGNVLTRSISDFQVRDSRETCRRTIHTSFELLARFGEQTKIDEKAFSRYCLSPVQQLWTFSDRAIRTVLLRTLKPLLYLLSRETVNKKLFDPLLSGFSDSNSRLREDTLKCLVDVVEKLDENQLQEKLVRCICNLQNDSEASVRTNAVIFLSRIASKLSAVVQHRVLANCYSKAMKDPFLHCRIAGLKATDASISQFDMNQICTKLLPQISLLLIDKSRDVCELALKVMETCIQSIRNQHNLSKAKIVSEPEISSSSNSETLRSSSSGTGKGAWTAWALESLTKSVEKVADDSSHVQHLQQSKDAISKASNEALSKQDSCIGDSSRGVVINDSVEGWGDIDVDLGDSLDDIDDDDRKVRPVESYVRKTEVRSAERRKNRQDSKPVPTVKKMAVDPDEKDSWDDF